MAGWDRSYAKVVYLLWPGKCGYGLSDAENAKILSACSINEVEM